MRPLPVCTARVLKTLLFLLLVATLGMYGTIEMMFNMTGHQYWPTFSIGTWRSQENDGKATFQNHRTLVDVKEGVKSSREHRSNNNSVKHSILWYKKPDWIWLDRANEEISRVCSYQNCFMTDDDTGIIQNHSAIVFTMTQPNKFSPPIQRVDRRPDQVWIFFGLESPINHKLNGYRHRSWSNTMNWSMSYRTDSDIFFPYGMLETLQPGVKPVQPSVFRRKTKHAAWIVSHCRADSMRDEYVQEMIDFGLKVDIFGRCSGSEKIDISQLKRTIEMDYKFYLSFENSHCTDYITEKFFTYFRWEIVLVTRGGANYSRLLPENTFIDTARFQSAKELVVYLLQIADSEDKYLNFLNEKSKYLSPDRVPSPYCSICEKLNRLEENRKSYSDHVTYIHEDMCWAPNDLSKFHMSITMYLLLGCFTTICILGCVWKWCKY
ncbi:4-galactosyl-N-acetylglucosaminide 3-alpha-L-fucosyltransferase FUT6-like isoform X7 [Dreissena polymorpha]|nr:4-galactosyl-N-acetylglucosaminide 3-alpha-L-fucosyltransferase FUT6-like isoform X7 [Dreissena polymorpha]XP_052244160.1 4-galactosyl-N-acetylglucosaminide 3-alpha-L-fucosyltransferase FUT6-like isoform X7 [Dreissena polymorpha]XP_052244161.1 4-galactosyl-N-acetylglucosaminide 3-alpha-L-fucosyltransferase FUT6-like isoform X7 [Dreissena polymorpha]XP_052244162.1 4-galactosyl-N-acetylglucosaminide 3-alpha-L-fucosyltransferase FUT6-like isoform X7 [Dreissena polymorpha]XP_052244163.1 4-galact